MNRLILNERIDIEPESGALTWFRLYYGDGLSGVYVDLSKPAGEAISPAEASGMLRQLAEKIDASGMGH